MSVADTLYDACVAIRDDIENHGIGDYWALEPEIRRLLYEMDYMRRQIDAFCAAGVINPVVEACRDEHKPALVFDDAVMDREMDDRACYGAWRCGRARWRQR